MIRILLFTVIFLINCSCSQAKEIPKDSATTNKISALNKKPAERIGLQDLYGKWVIDKCQLAGVGSMTDEDVKKIIGRTCIFSPVSILFGNSSCKKPEYKFTNEKTVDYLPIVNLSYT